MTILEDVDPIIRAILDTGQNVEDFLKRNWRSKSLNARFKTEAEQHLIGDIGLRIRPYLFRLSCESGKIEFRDVLPIAAGIEMLQVSTLVIDDVLDESTCRNKARSLYSAYGAKMAMCIGAILSSHAFSLMARGLEANGRLLNGSKLIRVMSECHADIYAGQFADLENERIVSVTEDEYIDLVALTTASFIRASLVTGAILWNAPGEFIRSLEEIGRTIGIGYQIRDDIIDIIGSPEFTGKPVGGDVRQCKMRLPMIHALKLVGQRDRQKLEALLNGGVMSDADFSEAMSLVKNSGAVGYCITKTQEYCRDAAKATDLLPAKFGNLKTALSVLLRLISNFDDAESERG